MTTKSRCVLLVVHGGRSEAVATAVMAVADLRMRGIAVCVDAGDNAHEQLTNAGADIVDGSMDCELALVFGGDGTVLRGAEAAHAHQMPLLAFNMGHVGFLAEAEIEDLAAVLDAIEQQSYTVESRMALAVVVERAGSEHWANWALNEVSIERGGEPRILDLGVSIDGEPLTRFGADGIVCASATGSTAYAFSAGGPVVWPELEAMSLVPVAAHALFARPLVVAPASTITIDILSSNSAFVWADGRRGVPLAYGDRLHISRSPRDVHFARVHQVPFTRRLVGKFQLPLNGWREVPAGPEQ
jgi:NAD+ kinase